MLFFLLISSCSKRIKKKYYYPNLKEVERTTNKRTIRINSFSSFEEFKSEMWGFYQITPGKTPILLLETENTEYHIKYINEFGCIPPIIKLKNLIGISKDSIYKWEKYYPIEKLENILKTDLLNYGQHNKYADNPSSLIIQFLHPENESISNLEHTLLNLLKIFNAINLQAKDSLELNIRFEKLIPLKRLRIPTNENE